ncbi:hypothetical protein [Paractinoplanes rishiriensis]|uniref:Lipoprotein n=1 Tax=Paractinoplanes rishiriensis TaxID=1050105 RepID=A0A919K1D8_9ACTN|nr:hypothetical protein [Actinoplanes rishiriensis]GIE97427.1 hypothetical protein Ari01nite_48920 [Actinoplanes rishiriensis]
MRRAVQTLVVGGALLFAAACGTSKSPAPADADTPAVGASAGAAAQPAALAETKALCEGLGQVYNKNMGLFAESLTKMVGSKGAKADVQEAQVALKTFSTAVLQATEKSADAQLKADGQKAAGQLQAKSADAAFFKTIKTNEDVNKVLGPTLKEWLSPVQTHCS